MKKDEMLKDLILSQIYRELLHNTSMKEKGETCKSIVLSIDAGYKYSLDRVLKHKDFLPYNIEKVKENSEIF